jgi:TonB family protein
MAQTKPPEATAMGAKYLLWVSSEEVSSIITPKEKEVFFRLGTDRERDFFIDAFWKQRTPASSAPVATPWTMKMRVYEVPGKGTGTPVKSVTSSYLNYKLTATIKTEYDLAEEMKQIQKTFNYAGVKLLTEADFSWKGNGRDRAFHIFRLDGHEYVVLATPIDIARRLVFRLEVLEQGDKSKVNLLDTEFTIPEKNIAVFGFEDSKGNTYFLSFRVTGWKAAAFLQEAGGGAPPYVIPAEGPVRAVGEIKPPRLIKQVDPIYPEIARQSSVEGVVILEVGTDIYGRVSNVKILRSIPLLDQAAIDSVRQWVYEPLVIDGKPRGCIFTVTVRFALDGGKPTPRREGEPLKITGDVKGPKLMKQVDPIYPEAARKARVEGVVIMEVSTDIYGRVRDIKILRSIPLLDQAALDAVRQWVYEPPIIDGKPISLTFTVTVRFTLDGEKPAVGGVMGGVVGGKEGEAGENITVVETKGVSGGTGGGLIWVREDAKNPAKDELAPIKAEGEIKPPKRIKSADPVYPDDARKAGIQGTVVLQAETDSSGKIRRIRSLGVKSETDMNGAVWVSLLQAAIDAVKQWEYEPLVVDGKPRAVVFTVTVRFTLK